MKGIYILLGTNLGNREANLQQALELVEKNSIRILQLSSVYETAAWGKTDQLAFFNQVAHVATSLPPPQLLEVLLATEARMGRIRKEKWGERLIDLDILYYDQLVVEEPNLQIPHKGITDRRFTLVPLVEIAPDFIHPIHLKTQAMLLNACKDQLPVQKFSDQ